MTDWKSFDVRFGSSTALKVSKSYFRSTPRSGHARERYLRARSGRGGAASIVCDGGIRRGSHIVKALAAGATACSIGRPYLYGLAVGGEHGVDRVIRILIEEFDRCLALLGVSDIREIHASLLSGTMSRL